MTEITVAISESQTITVEISGLYGDAGEVTPTPEPSPVYQSYLGQINFKAASEINLEDLSGLEIDQLTSPYTWQHVGASIGNKSLVLAFPASKGTVTSMKDQLGTNVIGISYEVVQKTFVINGVSIPYVICSNIKAQMFNQNTTFTYTIN